MTEYEEPHMYVFIDQRKNGTIEKDCDRIIDDLPENEKYTLVLVREKRLDKFDKADIEAAGEVPKTYPFALTDDGRIITDYDEILKAARRKKRKKKG